MTPFRSDNLPVVYGLRKNGCYTLYNVYRGKMMMSNVSDMKFSVLLLFVMKKVVIQNNNYNFASEIQNGNLKSRKE